MSRTGILFLCAAVPLAGIALAVKYGPRDAARTTAASRSAPQRSAAATRSSATATSDVPAPRANGVAITLPDLPSLRVGLDEDAAVRKKLAQVVDLDLTDVPLDKALERLSEAAKVNIVLNRNSLAEVGIEPNEPITFRGKGRQLGDALRSALKPNGLAWIVKDDVVRVTSWQDENDHLFVRFYDLRPFRKAFGPKPLAPCEPHMPTLLCTQGITPSEIAAWEKRYAEQLPPPPHDRIVDVMMNETSGPWLEFDGTGGTATASGDLLVVRQFQKVHDEIDSLLPILLHAVRGKLDHGEAALWPASPQDRGAEAAIRTRLREPISVDFRGTPLRRALDSIRERLGIRLRIDEAALAEDGTRSDVPVTLKVSEIPARSVLTLLLDPLDLTALVREAELVVTSENVARNDLATTAYDVRDIADRLETWDPAAMFFDGTSGPWAEFDGTGGVVYAVAEGILVVRQTQNWSFAFHAAALRESGETECRRDGAADPGRVWPCRESWSFRRWCSARSGSSATCSPPRRSGGTSPSTSRD